MNLKRDGGRCRPIFLVAVLVIMGWPGDAVCGWPVQSSADPGHGTGDVTRSDLESRLQQIPAGELARRVMARGDAARGALVYYNPAMTCVKCHEPAADSRRLGPAIAELTPDATTEHLIESLLEPSREITDGFATWTVLTVDGHLVRGLVVAEDPTDDGFLMMADPDRDGQPTRIAKPDIEERRRDQVSAMPDGLVGALADEQSFLDLIRYLVEIRRGGNNAVLRLRPPDSFFAVEPLPEYEADIDHAGMIAALNDDSFQRGAILYQRSCARCHGTREQPGTMPSARRFFDSEFKNGNDPLSLYRTLTHGYGLMVAQRWMVPRQKYDVIHYIREHFIRNDNPDQYFAVTGPYLAGLPAGTGRGPDPVERTPWSDMDYGNFLFNTLEVGTDGSNIAYKGIAIRLDEGPGGVSQGRHWMLYEHDTMRVAAAWSGSGFIDYHGIHFDDQHNVHPRITGDLHFANDHQPGWANPQTGSFADDLRLVGRDGKRYGPLPAQWLKYRGLYQYGNRAVLEYTVGDTAILESPSLEFRDGQPVFTRTLNLDPRNQPLLVRVADVGDLQRAAEVDANVALFESRPDDDANPEIPGFDGRHFVVADQVLNWHQDLTVLARIRTDRGGTILCQTADQSEWVRGGSSLFIRDGRLVFDIGWVGAITSRRRVDDGQWHTLALVRDPDAATVQLFIDGQLDQSGNLATGDDYPDPVLRFGFTADNFPNPLSNFTGQISHLMVWNRLLGAAEIAGLDPAGNVTDQNLIGDWRFHGSPIPASRVVDRSPSQNNALWIENRAAAHNPPSALWARVIGMSDPVWQVVDGSLCLQIPAGPSPLEIAIATGGLPERESMRVKFEDNPGQPADSIAHLRAMTGGGPPPFPDVLTSVVTTRPQADSDPFAVDFLEHPQNNPWHCRLRLTGLDFRDEHTLLVCTWDGSVWEVAGISGTAPLKWRRVANGLFQPLGIHVLNDQVYVTCRDQIVALQDLNGDGVFDYYRAFNSDHQVTEHFHEFAMGLQSDADGNRYYAKSARHALPALVPQHGTLLKVSADGSQTEIVARGFRAANGVCLNPDGSFFVTDQEGHWNPKNRINWVEPGGFYGNMLGFHDITDESDAAMQQPLCWITNAFDRSPGELLWVPPDAWGPLGGSLLNLSYGMGQIFVVPHESVRFRGVDQLQGGMCALPIPLFPTGVMRGRFDRHGDLYCCGMYAWAGNQQQPGGLYRVRYTGQSVYLPGRIATAPGKIAIEFASPLDPETIVDTDRYAIETWDIRRSAEYGSPHLNQRELGVAAAELRPDRHTLELSVPGLQPTRCMEIRCRIRTSDGRDVIRTIHNTIHAVGQSVDSR